jgi:hypothetical protein
MPNKTPMKENKVPCKIWKEMKGWRQLMVGMKESMAE